MIGVLWFIIVCMLLSMLIYSVIDRHFPPRCSYCRKEGFYWCFHKRAYRFEWMKKNNV